MAHNLTIQEDGTVEFFSGSESGNDAGAENHCQKRSN